MADFYELLVYETGGFFVDHCDTAESWRNMGAPAAFGPSWRRTNVDRVYLVERAALQSDS
ncbi:hypothetical protein [Bradyrhizobium paxllaeri]|uniref:hypothetical protein n=1 Tax=Bradyrhizobium paxllaeri TaxID=190148 RepID=UPI0011478930|nr:hypothetical protein [Bradyrhizobium paxllaeri]